MSSDLMNMTDGESPRLDPRLSELIKVVLITQVGGQGSMRVNISRMLPTDADEIREIVEKRGLG